MKRLHLMAPVAVLFALSNIVSGELLFTTEVSPTTGLPELNTYRISATSDLGNIVAFDFTQVGSYGITGPINQVSLGEQETIFANFNSAFGSYDPSQDTQFLVDRDEVLSLFLEESSSYLHGAFAFIGERQRTIGNSLPFLQIATADPLAVSLSGALVIRRPNDELVEMSFNFKLSDISVGPAPLLSVLPIPDPVPLPVEVPEPAIEVPTPVVPAPEITVEPPIGSEETPITIVEMPGLTTEQPPQMPEPIELPEVIYVGERPVLIPDTNWLYPYHLIDITTLQSTGIESSFEIYPTNINGLTFRQSIAAWNCDLGTTFAQALDATSSPAVPEPTTTALLALGVCCVITVRQRTLQ